MNYQCSIHQMSLDQANSRACLVEEDHLKRQKVIWADINETRLTHLVC